MKKILTAVTVLLFLAGALFAQEQQRGNVRKAGSIDYGAGLKAEVTTNAGGRAMVHFRNTMLDMDLQENRQLTAVLQKASDYVDVVTGNNTSIRLTLSAGQMITSNDVKVIVDFSTDGTGGNESCLITIHLTNPASTEVVKFNQAQTQQLIGYLNECFEVADSVKEQLNLFLAVK